MLASKPILDSNNLIKDPVELSGCGIIVQPESASAIVKGILDMYSMSKEEREKMAALGKEYVQKFHSIKNLSNQYINLFEQYH